MNYFDKIYCLHMVNDKVRYEHIKNHLEKYDLLNNTFITMFPKMNINNICGKLVQSIHTIYYDYVSPTRTAYGSIFSCAYNWLMLIKSAYEQGLEHILCMEDDIIFNVNKDELYNYFDNMPKDYDIVKFAWSFSNGYNGNNGFDHFIANKYNNLFVKVNNTYKINDTSLFALSRNGMKYYIDYMEDNFVCADIPFCELEKTKFFTDDINYYITNKSLSNNCGFGSITNNVI